MSENYVDHLNDFNGEKYTWDPTYSKDGVTIKASHQEKYHAFYLAAHYEPGVEITGANVGKWFLPSLGEWNLFFKNLNLSDTDFGYESDTKYPYSPSAYGFFRVGGVSLQLWSNSSVDFGYNYYLSSSEHSADKHFAWFAQNYEELMPYFLSIRFWGGASVVHKGGSGGKAHIRPFIHY